MVLEFTLIQMVGGIYASQSVEQVPVPDRRIRNISEVVLVRRWAVGVLGIWKGRVWVKGGGKSGSVYKQPETEVDDSCHS
jgi:hypothetical protein